MKTDIEILEKAEELLVLKEKRELTPEEKTVVAQSINIQKLNQELEPEHRRKIQHQYESLKTILNGE